MKEALNYVEFRTMDKVHKPSEFHFLFLIAIFAAAVVL
jgi:hypothetical protein